MEKRHQRAFFPIQNHSLHHPFLKKRKHFHEMTLINKIQKDHLHKKMEEPKTRNIPDGKTSEHRNQ